MTLATISNRKMRRGLGTSPETYGDIEEATDISGFGEQAPLVNVTNFDSTSQEYIGGLADGQEFSVTCNDVPTATNQAALKATAIGTTIAMQFAKTNVSPETVANFNAVYLGYEEQPSPTEQNQIAFQFKITGGIT